MYSGESAFLRTMLLYSGKVALFGENGCIGKKVVVRAKVVVFRQGGFTRAKVLLFGQKWLCWGKVVVFGQSVCDQAKVILFLQSGCIRAKVVVFLQKWMYSGRGLY